MSESKHIEIQARRFSRRAGEKATQVEVDLRDAVRKNKACEPVL